MMPRPLTMLHSLPGSFVQAADFGQQPDAVPVFEIQELVEAPVQVVREKGELLPQLVGGVPA
ncbi:hypothetical protein Are01nite_61470 [Actinoplanes regularis]|nr:hypothetical protein Are01nite_61470 [Actinoplanes regularis]